MKNIKYIVLTMLLPMLFSCEKQLLEQVNPNAVTTGSFWQTEDDFEKGLNATYSALQFPAVSGGNLQFDMLRSDFAGTEVWYSAASEFTSLQWNDATSYVTNAWAQHYIGIFRANQILHYIEGVNINGFTEEEQTLIKAQARFIRAFNYFKLVHLFNQAVIHDKLAFTDAELNKELSPKSEVLSTIIIPDLEYAAANLPKKWDANNTGRVTWGAATAMLGKTYLYEKDWTNAQKYFKEVIDEADNTGLYRLTSDIMANFTLEGEFNSESIFEVAFSDNYKQSIPGDRVDDVGTLAGTEAQTLASAFASITGAGGYNTVLPTYWLHELFVAADSMDTSNPMNVGRTYSSRTYASIVVEQGDGDYYQAPLIGAGEKVNFSYGQSSKVRKYTNWYHLESEDAANNSRSGINLRHIRLADVYLMYAEALLSGGGDLNTAISFIDRVRSRAGVLTLEHYMTENGGQIPQLDKSRFAANGTRTFVAATAENVLHHLRMVERPLELCFEGHRWFDLVRWGIAGDVFTERAAEEAIFKSKLVNADGTVNTIFPIFLKERIRPNYATPAANYSSSTHDYFPIPTVEFQTNGSLSN